MLFFVSLGVYITTLAVNEGSTNSAVFNVKEKYRNPHSVFHKSSDHQTLLSCGHACLRNPRCKATNFRSGENGQHRAVCELLDGPLTELHNALEFDKDWVFSHSMEDDCRFVSCTNGGSCDYDSNIKHYRCFCPLLWAGDRCQQIHVANAVFKFTTLGFHGRLGPTTNKRYQATVLENTPIVRGVQTWTVPISGKYHVTACGAAGGNGYGGSKGGKGAFINGTIQLQKGEELKIIIGQSGGTRGNKTYGSGGGGTFIIRRNVPVAIAGGGGGGGYFSDGGDGRGDCGNNPGVGGEVCAHGIATFAGGGGGFRGSGTCYSSGDCVTNVCKFGGKAFMDGGGEGGVASGRATPDCNGGFGGGGASDNAGGGGGGYSGGSVKIINGTKNAFAEGGCSLAPSDGLLVPGHNDGDGYATIKLLT